MSKRRNVPFIAFYPSDWISGVRLLPTVERALYHEMCLASSQGLYPGLR